MPRLVPALCLLVLVACGDQAGNEAHETEAGQARVVVYTSRQPYLIEPLFERYTAQTGVTIDYASDNEASLIERIAAEGQRTQADLFMTVDAGNLWHAAERGLLQPAASDVLADRIPAALADDLQRWYGLSVRARTIVYHPDRVDPSELSSYEDLADERWAGRLCLRTSRKVYNQSLVALLIEHHGEQRAEEIVRGWVSNLATNPIPRIPRLSRRSLPASVMWPSSTAITSDASWPTIRVTRLNCSGPTRAAPAYTSTSPVPVSRVMPPAPTRLVPCWNGWPRRTLRGSLPNVTSSFRPIRQSSRAGWWLRGVSYQADDTPLTVAGERQAQAVRLMDRAGYR
jgi:iron(III) transport system substrate-binding protein